MAKPSKKELWKLMKTPTNGDCSNCLNGDLSSEICWGCYHFWKKFAPGEPIQEFEDEWVWNGETNERTRNN